MNPIYTLMESRHRWLIVASVSFVVAVVGAMATLAYDWPHWLGQAWFYLWAAGTFACLVFAFLDWRSHLAQ